MKTSDLSYSLMSILFTKKYNQMVSDSHHAVFCTSMDKISLTAVHWMNIVIIFRFLHWTYMFRTIERPWTWCLFHTWRSLLLSDTAAHLHLHKSTLQLWFQFTWRSLLCFPRHQQLIAILALLSVNALLKEKKKKIECTMQDFLRKQIMLRVVIRILQMTTNRSRFSIYIAFKAWQSIVLHSE